MNKDKKRSKESLWEGLLEILLALVLFGIGAIVVSLFDGELNLLSMDFELLFLIGVAVLVAAFGIVYASVKIFKKIMKFQRK